jgi:hypothetical protein
MKAPSAPIVAGVDGSAPARADHQQFGVLRGLDQVLRRVAHDHALGDVRSAGHRRARLVHGVVEFARWVPSGHLAVRVEAHRHGRHDHRLLVVGEYRLHSGAPVCRLFECPLQCRV